METKEYTYNGKVVEFFFGEDVMVNATEMVEVFGKRLSHFLSLESTKKWIVHLEKTAFREVKGRDSRHFQSANAVLLGEIKHKSRDLVPLLIVKKGREGETWMHRLLAIELAMWLDIDFKLWVILKIDQMLFDYGMEKRNIAIERKKAQENLDKLFAQNGDNPAVIEIRENLKSLNELKGAELNLHKNFKKNLFN